MPRKCVNSSDAFCYICGELTFKFRRRSFTPLIKKCYDHYFGCKVGDQDKSWVPNFCCDMCHASRSLVKSFTLCAFPHSYGLDRTRGPCFRLLRLPDQYHWCNSKVQIYCSVSQFTICDEASTSQCGVNVPKPPTNMTLSDSESSDIEVGQANKKYGL